jgi:hypothetical protein
MLGAVNPSTGALPFQSLRVADLGNVNVNLYNLQDSCLLIREAYQNVLAAGCIPLTLGKGKSQGQGCFFSAGEGGWLFNTGLWAVVSPGEATVNPEGK